MSQESLVLFKELPDSDLQLYHQSPLIDDLSGFWNLAPVVRKIIWNLIRGRRILATLDSYGRLHSRTPPPVTFRICQESRYFTIPYYKTPLHLRYYASTYNLLVKPPRAAFQCHFYDSAVDTVVLHGRNPSDASCYFQHSTSIIGENLTEIKSLEVKRFDWALMMFRGWSGWSRSPSPQFTYFRCFGGLEKLVIVGGGHGLRTTKEQEECKAAFKRIFEDFNDIYHEFKVPEVLIKME